MQNFFKLIDSFIRGQKIWRIPMYELLRNDAITSYFGGEPINLENGQRIVYSSYEPAIDATRPQIRTTNVEKIIKFEDGKEQRYFRWTIWTSHLRYKNEEVYKSEKQKAKYAQLFQHSEEQKAVGDIYYFLIGPCNWFTRIYDEVGLEDFSLYWVYFPELIDQILECHAQETIAWAEHLPAGFEYNGVFRADDIAFNMGTLMPEEWFNRSYFHRLKRICDAFHKRNIKVLFHSDEDLYPILDGLVDTGIERLNPI